MDQEMMRVFRIRPIDKLDWLILTAEGPLAWDALIEQIDLQCLLDDDGEAVVIECNTMPRAEFDALPAHEGW